MWYTLCLYVVFGRLERRLTSRVTVWCCFPIQEKAQIAQESLDRNCLFLSNNESRSAWFSSSLGTGSDSNLTSKDLSSLHSVPRYSFDWPDYSFLPAPFLDRRLVERSDSKEPTEAIGLVNYVVSRVGSDLGELGAANIEPDVTPGEPQGSIELLTNSAPLKVALTVKAAHSDSTGRKRDEGARCADDGSESDLSDRPQVELCRICGQQVRGTKSSSHGRLLAK